jgi:hypothetical protein
MDAIVDALKILFSLGYVSLGKLRRYEQRKNRR